MTLKMNILYTFLLLIGVVSINGGGYKHWRKIYRPRSIFSKYVFNFVKNAIDFDEFTLTPGLSVTVDFNAPGAWNHEGQYEWGSNFPLCDGRFQSPINLVLDDLWDIPDRTCLRWNNYQDDSAYLTLQNTGHSLDASSTWRTGAIPTLSGGVLTGTYRLSSIHFHWGSGVHGGSEHTIDSKRFPLEMHLVHYNTLYGNLENAISTNIRDALAVVGILFELSDISNPGIRHITKAMMAASSNGVQNNYLPLHSLGTNFQADYYTYLGSLTTPTCNPVVRWIVSSKIEKIAPKELDVFQSLLVNNKPLVNNFRQTQPLNGRLTFHVKDCTG